jgi:hypothetical protein
MPSLDCVWVWFDMSFKPIEQPNAPVSYGRHLEYSKAASLYEPQTKEASRESFPSLQSGFYAAVLIEGGRSNINVKTRSEFKDSQPYLEIVNSSSSELYFSLPELVNLYDERFDEAVQKASWQRVGDDHVYILRRNSSATLLIPGKWQSNEGLTPLLFHSPDGRSIVASTTISIYFGR